MAKYIDADVLLEKFRTEIPDDYGDFSFTLSSIEMIIEEISPAHVIVIPHGYWSYAINSGYYYCSECGCEVEVMDDICPNCGANMVGADEYFDEEKLE